MRSNSSRLRPDLRVLLALILLALLVAGCAAGPNPTVGVESAEGDVAGFWMGLWQGIIAPVTFVISLFTDDVNIYEVHNNGNWYDFGFMLGIGVFTGGGCGGGRAARRR